MPVSEFGAIFKQCRKSTHLSGKQLGYRINRSNSYISKVEHGEIFPTSDIFRQIIDIFKEHNLSDEEIDRLWKASNLPLKLIEWPSKDSPAHPKILSINIIINKLKEPAKTNVMNTVSTLAEVYRDLYSCEEILNKRGWKKAIENLQEIEENANNLHEFYAKFYELKAIAYYGDGKYDSAIEANILANQSLEILVELYMEKEKGGNDKIDTIIKSNKVKQRIAKVYSNLGDIFRRKADWDWAKENYTKAAKIYDDLSNQPGISSNEGLIGKGNCIRRIAGVYNYIGQADKALNDLKECKEIFEKTEYRKGLYKTWQHEAWSYRLLGKWDDAIDLNKKALDQINSEVDIDKWELMKAHYFLGESYNPINPTNARNSYQKALNILGEINDTGRDARLQEGMIKIGLGSVLQRLTDGYLEARQLFTESLNIHNEQGEEFWIGVNRYNLGNLLADMQENSKLAEALLLQSLYYFKHIEVPLYQLGSIVHLCQYYYKTGNYDSVYEWYQQSILVGNEETTMKIHRARISIILGKTYTKEREISKSLEAFSEALEYSLSYNKYVFNEIVNEILEFAEEEYRKNNSDIVRMILSLDEKFVAGRKFAEAESRIVLEMGVIFHEKRLKLDINSLYAK
jgi:transcriptional regulator with XRE-family HTH domain